MPVRSPSQSVFRPRQPLDRSALAEDKALLADINRRNVLRGTVSLGALSLLTGCDVSDSSAVRSMLLAVSAWNDRVQQFMFRPHHLAPTFSEAQVMKPPRFNAFYSIDEVKPVDAARWTLELAGRVADKRPWRAGELDALPQQELIVRHICVEGWDYIGQWSGVNFRTFLERVGADLTAKYIAFKCADGYSESLDMPTALHAQTILATRYAREPITDPFGFPVRLRAATKLGFKNPKWITAIEVTNTFPSTYWSERGFNWFSGI